MIPSVADTPEYTPSLTVALQALLTRHEAYVKDSEQDRSNLAMKIETLEKDKLGLEKLNADVVRENRGLLDQLESLNDAIIDSDNQVTNLQATLQSSQQEIHRLAHLAARTAKLESQIADFERDQARWQSTLTDREQSEKAALRRWQQSERTLADISRQIEAIEMEAKEERDRHAEVVARMERRHAVERELDSSAARLKGAAAVKTAENATQGTNVVSHFVRDLLQDNTALQSGVLELREMLDNSNLQVEALRRQLTDQQVSAPITPSVVRPQPEAIRTDLNDEMKRANAQELHVHHHYHAPSAPKQPAVIRRPKKKRYGALMSGHFTPPTSGISTPRSSISYSIPSSHAAILSSTAASLPENYHAMRAFSGPSSPGSTNRTSSIFDNVFSDAGLDSSRPTTPGTEEPASPMMFPIHSKRSSISSFQHRSRPSGHRSRSSLDAIMDVGFEHLEGLDLRMNQERPIPEEEDLSWDESHHPSAEDETPSSNDQQAVPSLSDELDRAYERRNRRLRRVNSHDSLLSVSGMDIHLPANSTSTLKPRPSQLLAPYNSASRSFTTQAVLSDATAHAARPAILSSSSSSYASTHSLLSGMAADRLHPNKASSSSSSANNASSSSGSGSGLGNRIGWVFGKWGATPTPAVEAPPSSSTTTTTSSARSPSISSVAASTTSSSIVSSNNNNTDDDVHASPSATDPQLTPKPAPLPAPSRLRSFGVNQSGPIPFFPVETKTPPRPPVVNVLDEEGLRKVLDMG
jgi:hypothetical protein